MIMANDRLSWCSIPSGNSYNIVGKATRKSLQSYAEKGISAYIWASSLSSIELFFYLIGLKSEVERVKYIYIYIHFAFAFSSLLPSPLSPPLVFPRDIVRSRMYIRLQSFAECMLRNLKCDRTRRQRLISSSLIRTFRILC